ncbi:MAG: hypothetical protein PHR83_02775 [Paludibacter sp.]|nr:hypothetical protein [Paludibacter sp.]
MNIRCVAIEQSLQVRSELEESIKEFANVELVRVFNNPSEAIDFLNTDRIDFLFVEEKYRNDFGHSVFANFKNKSLLVITSNDTSLSTFNDETILNPACFSSFFQAISTFRSKL